MREGKKGEDEGERQEGEGEEWEPVSQARWRDPQSG